MPKKNDKTESCRSAGHFLSGAAMNTGKAKVKKRAMHQVDRRQRRDVVRLKQCDKR